MSVLGEIKAKVLDNQLKKAWEDANELYKQKQDTVICEYCRQLMPKSEAGTVFDLETKELIFFHEKCFNENEQIGTAEDLERAAILEREEDKR